MALAGISTSPFRTEEDEFGLPRNYHYPSRFYLTHLFRQLNAVSPGSCKNYDNEIYNLQMKDGGWPAHPNNGYPRIVETCLAVLSLETLRLDEVARAASFIRSRQSKNGAWERGCRIWNYYDDTEGITLREAMNSLSSHKRWWAVDTHAVFSTCLGIQALQCLQENS
tara:strand:+ start:1949 stop:2449 length:501 start_codon:yes stop_codon:yes gene_type:complete